MVASIYRSPGQNLYYFLSLITSSYDHYLKDFEDFFIFGDFNESNIFEEIAI